MSKTRKDIFGSNVQPKRRIEPKRSFWRCAECGKTNAAHFVQCNHCGAYDE